MHAPPRARTRGATAASLRRGLALGFADEFAFELNQPRVRKVKGQRNSGNALGRKPFVAEITRRAKREAAPIEFSVELADQLLQRGIFYAYRQVAQAQLQQLLFIDGIEIDS